MCILRCVLRFFLPSTPPFASSFHIMFVTFPQIQHNFAQLKLRMEPNRRRRGGHFPQCAAQGQYFADRAQRWQLRRIPGDTKVCRCTRLQPTQREASTIQQLTPSHPEFCKQGFLKTGKACFSKASNHGYRAHSPGSRPPLLSNHRGRRVQQCFTPLI